MRTEIIETDEKLKPKPINAYADFQRRPAAFADRQSGDSSYFNAKGRPSGGRIASCTGIRGGTAIDPRAA